MESPPPQRWDRSRWVSVFSSHSPTVREVTESLGLGSSSSARGIPKFDAPEQKKLSSEVTRLSKELPKERDKLLDFAGDADSLKLELDSLLETLGPAIWGRDADRSRLLTPDPTKKTYYKDLVFEEPDDKQIIQIHLHRWIVIKACYYIRNMKLKRPSLAEDDSAADLDAASPSKPQLLSPNATPRDGSPADARDSTPMDGVETAKSLKRKGSAFVSFSDGEDAASGASDSSKSRKRYASATMPNRKPREPRKSLAVLRTSGSPAGENRSPIAGQSSQLLPSSLGPVPSRPLSPVSGNATNGSFRPVTVGASGFTAVNVPSRTHSPAQLYVSPFAAPESRAPPSSERAVEPMGPDELRPRAEHVLYREPGVQAEGGTLGDNTTTSHVGQPHHVAPAPPRAPTPSMAPSIPPRAPADPLPSNYAVSPNFSHVQPRIAQSHIIPKSSQSPLTLELTPIQTAPERSERPAILSEPAESSRREGDWRVEKPAPKVPPSASAVQPHSASRNGSPFNKPVSLPPPSLQPRENMKNPAPLERNPAGFTPIVPSNAYLNDTARMYVSNNRSHTSTPPAAYANSSESTRTLPFNHRQSLAPVHPPSQHQPHGLPQLPSEHVAQEHPFPAASPSTIELLQYELFDNLARYLFQKAGHQPEAMILSSLESIWSINATYYQQRSPGMFDTNTRVLYAWIGERRKIGALRESLAQQPGMKNGEVVDRLLALNDLRMLRLKWKMMKSDPSNPQSGAEGEGRRRENGEFVSAEDVLCKVFAMMTRTEGTEETFRQGLDILSRESFGLLKEDDKIISLRPRPGPPPGA
ncbi:hypothetical protein P154DRAFT_522907 [Amniculicola lignicola CBS 123094]|uniref:Uncharacterized protein n=1 Tax=Amniculicola lignicola CBS 123094 TaxID=1392246 RepID=A0A6A5WH64_9PLEO|nr:hypothetical protein P154DRAFT_522907 [Amniculicola lignicola CBS 123094]